MSWLVRPHPNPAAQLRLFCFPFAGGGVSAFYAWPAGLGRDLDVCAVQLPGRENRLRESAFQRMSKLIPAVEQALHPFFDVPFALFGHSYGAVICFELARRLRSEHKLVPVHLFASARHAPQLPDRFAPICGLSDDQFTAELMRRYDGIPAEVLNNPELLELMLPTLRADCETLETYRYEDDSPLDCPISVFGGHQDNSVTDEELLAWREQTCSTFNLRKFAGNHFYLKSAQTEVWSAILDLLNLSSASRTDV